MVRVDSGAAGFAAPCTVVTGAWWVVLQLVRARPRATDGSDYTDDAEYARERSTVRVQRTVRTAEWPWPSERSYDLQVKVEQSLETITDSIPHTACVQQNKTV